MRADGRPGRGTREIDGAGLYVMPGFVDLHVHTGGGPKAPDADYVYKLWLAHGVTTVRGVPAGSMDWTLRERDRSARNAITAPRIFAYHRPGTGDGWMGGPITTPEKATEWVTWAAKKGVDGVKLGAEDPEVMKALIATARSLNLGTAAHLAQTGIARMNLRDAARLGLHRRSTSTASSTRCSPTTPCSRIRPTTTTTTSSIASARSRRSGTRSTRAAARNGTS